MSSTAASEDANTNCSPQNPIPRAPSFRQDHERAPNIPFRSAYFSRLSIPVRPLKVASVIGEIFTWDVLRAVLPVDLDEETLTKHLNTLVFKNFLTMENNPSSTSQCFKFTHSMVRVCCTMSGPWGRNENSKI